MAQVNARNRQWLYTLNNYTEDEEQAIQQTPCVYHVYGREVGDSGTPHLQGTIRFATLKSLVQMKKIQPRAHWEPAKKIHDSIEYCKKDGDVWECGTPPATDDQKGERGKAAMKEIIKRAREGDEAWLEENHPAEYYHHLSTFRSHKKAKTEVMSHSDEGTPHEWWVGPTGTGKSKKLWEEHPGHYKKDQNRWWCGYTGQDVVAIEEASPKTMEYLASRLKQWADRYPFAGEIKGGRLESIRPMKVIVLSNYTIDQCFPNEEDSEPLKRRFKVIRFGEEEQPKPWHNSYNKP